MKTSEQNIRPRRGRGDQALVPDFYLPAMWPFALQRRVADWVWAWRWRRRLRRLIALEARGQARLGSAREEVLQGARRPLQEIVAHNAARRGR